RYSTTWLLADPPGNKLSLLVQRQFWADRNNWHRYLLRRLLPILNTHALSDELESSTRRGLAYRAEEAWYKASRAWYHVRSDLGYCSASLMWSLQRQARAGGQRVVDEF